MIRPLSPKTSFSNPSDLKSDILDINRSPKGNMWSAIPVALLLVIVNWSEGKRGSGPEGDEVLQNTGGLSFVLPEEVDEML